MLVIVLDIRRVESTLDNTGVDACDREENGHERDGRELAHELDADEHAHADDDEQERAVDAKVVERVRLHVDVADERRLWTYVLEKDLDGAHNVHGSGYRVAQIEEYAHGAAELGAQRTRDHEVWPARWHYAVRGDCTR